VFTGEEETFGIATNVKCKVSNENLGLKNSDYLEAGNYEIDLYMKDLNGEQLVDKIAVSVEKSAPKPNAKTFQGEGDYFIFKNNDFKPSVAYKFINGNVGGAGVKLSIPHYMIMFL
jgi:hypothetical protein